MHGFLTGALVASIVAIASPVVQAGDFDPDTDPSRIKWTELAAKLGPAPNVRGRRFGIVLKTPTNEYWRLMAAGYRRRAAAVGVKIDIQAAQNETDQLRQLAILQTMIGSGYSALLISPISSFNLQPAIDEAHAAKIPIVDVDGAVVDSVRHFVGPINRDMGVHVANWFIRAYPKGGKVAVVEGQAGVFSTVQRSAGFRETLQATKRFEVAASLSGQWDRGKAAEVTRAMLQKNPDLIGIYCNNDTMALGAIDALKAMAALDRIKVFGSDGTKLAFAAIKAGELTGTVDIFPTMIGEIGLEVAERLSAGQPVTRVVETPQVLVTSANIARYDVEEDAKRRAVLDDAEASANR
ncbi:MAG: substrate-binding domain-containing protein [Methylobacterium sp.]|uniref:sugar ABC transporter substrate-binding protein n=1 Tax=Methylobacterium sp. TaxID=409 RepID=UPI0025D56DB5|nr:substrate-binding domain-containing protein [Methylobacterium sp.]MBX9934681.1 substrate-binding domain-containing protein [Methylobacterium sp.]